MAKLKHILISLIISQLALGWLWSGPTDFHLIKKVQAQDWSEDILSVEEEKNLLEKALRSSDNNLEPGQKETLQALAALEETANRLDVFYDDQPRLIMNPTDLAILKAKISTNSAKALLGNQDNQILTELANAIKDKNQQEAINLVKDGYNQLSDSNLKQVVKSAWDKLQAGQLTDGQEQIYDLASHLNYQYEDPQIKEYQKYQLDRRTLESLIFLVTPSSEGGAGHERIKVERIWNDFEDPNNPQVDEGQEEGFVSRHSPGQALDVSEVDTLKCTLVKKKRLGKDKKIKQAAKPIKVKYQTLEGAAEARQPYGESLQEIFQNLSQGNLKDAMIELGLVSDLTEEDLKNASFEDLADFLGMTFVQTLLDTGQMPKGSNMKDWLEKLGSGYLEESLGLPRGTFTGGTLNEMLENIGQRNLEDQLRLPENSLAGSSGDEILAQVGKRHLEQQTKNGLANYPAGQIDEALGLPDGYYNQIVNQGKSELYKDVGSQIIAERFSSNSLAREIIKTYLANQPSELTGWPKPSQTRPANNKTAYDGAVRIFENEFNQVHKPQCESEKGTATLTYPAYNPGQNKEISAAFHCQQSFQESDLPQGTIASLTGLQEGDFTRIFKGAGGRQVFRQMGRKIFYSQLRQSEAVQQKEQEFLAEHPELQEIKGEIEFRITALERAKEHLEKLKAILDSSDLQELKQDPEFQNSYQTAKQKLDEVIAKPTPQRIRETVKAVQRLLDLMEAKLGKDYTQTTKQQIKNHLEGAQYQLSAALEGEYRPLTETESSQSQNSDSDLSKYQALYQKHREIIDELKEMLNGHKTPRQVALVLASQQAAQKLGLPKDSLAFVLEDNPQLASDNFLRSIGQAKVKEVLGQESPQAAAARASANEVDRKLGLYPGDTQKLLDNQFTLDQYYERVGRQTLKTTVVSQVGKKLQVGDYYFTPDDFYQMLSGNTKEVFIKIAGPKLDSALKLRPGRGQNLLTADNTDERKLALAQLGADWLGNLLDMPPFDITGNVQQNMAASRMERALGLIPGSVKDNLETVLKNNGPVTFSQGFRIPLPFSSKYTQEQFQKDLALTSLKATENNKAQISEALVRLNQFKDQASQRIGQARDPKSSWWSNQKFVADLKQIDQILNIEINSTAQLLKGEIALNSYLTDKITSQSNFDYIFKNSDKIKDIIADRLGLEDQGKIPYRTVFLNNFNSFYEMVKSGSYDRPTLTNALADLYGSYVDDKLGFDTNSFSIIITQPDQRQRVLTEQGIKILDKELGLENESYNLDFLYRTFTQGDPGPTIQKELTNQIRAAIQKNTGILIDESDAQMASQGDVRIVGVVAGAYMIQEAGLFKDGQKSVPANLKPTYQDFRNSYLGNPADEQKINQAAQGDPDKRRTAELGLIKEYRKNLQYKIMDSQLYKLDDHTPAGFAKAMMEGDKDAKNLALSDLAFNLIRDEGQLGAAIANSEVRKAVQDWLKNPSPENLNRTIEQGLGSFENYLNITEKLGFKLQSGTLKALYTKDWNGLEKIYRDWGTQKIFSVADSQLGLPAGASLGIYQNYHQFNDALNNYKTVKNAVEAGALPKEDLNPAKAQLKQAEAAVATFVVNLVFSEQIGQMETKLGLVPGTGAILAGMTVNYLIVGGVDPVTLGIFIVLNLFGTYKVILVCTGDGYWPGLTSQQDINPSLDLDLGEFDGMNPSTYQQGIMEASQAKVDDLISDMMDLGYHYKNGTGFSIAPYDKPDELTKPIQILTLRQETLDKLFGSRQYREVFNSDPPSETNRQGIGISDLFSRWVHIGF